MVLAGVSFANESRGDGLQRKTVQAIPRGEHPIKIDGRLDEIIWSSAPVASGFVQKIPVAGVPAASPIQFRVLYDSTAIYVGIIARLRPGKSRPRALVLARDSPHIWYDNVIVVKLDPLFDQRTSFEFAINAAGTQADAIGLENGKIYRPEFDAIWTGNATVSDGSWNAEFRIPFAALGIPAHRGHHSMGLNVGVTDAPGINLWNEIPPPFGFLEARLYGEVNGLHDLAGGHPLSVEPYLSLQIFNDYSIVDMDVAGTSVGIQPGLDIHTRLGTSVWAEATFLTDFAQADLDDQVVNLDRFPLLFPEKRRFFLSQFDIFEFGMPGRAQPFFSRRIGLDDAGEQVPVLGGVKLHSRTDGFSLGVLDVVTGETGDTPMTNWSVTRARMNLTNAAHLGVMATTMHSRHLGDSAPATQEYFAGADAALRAMDGRLDLSGFSGVAGARGQAEALGWFAGLQTRWLGRSFTPSLSMLLIDEDFDPRIGFVQQTNLLEAQATTPWTYRPTESFIRELTVGLGGTYQTSASELEFVGARASSSVNVELMSGYRLASSWDYFQDVVGAEFELLPDLQIPAGTYTGGTGYIEIGSGRADCCPTILPDISVGYQLNTNFFGGRLHNAKLRLTGLFLTRHLELSGSANWSRITIPGFEPRHTLVINAAAIVRPSTSLSMDLVLQRNSVTDTISGMARLRWRYLPGSDIFVVYQENTQFAPDGRSLVLKASFRYDALF